MALNSKKIVKYTAMGLLGVALGTGACAIYDAQIDHTKTVCPLTKYYVAKGEINPDTMKHQMEKIKEKNIQIMEENHYSIMFLRPVLEEDYHEVETPISFIPFADMEVVDLDDGYAKWIVPEGYQLRTMDLGKGCYKVKEEGYPAIVTYNIDEEEANVLKLTK